MDRTERFAEFLRHILEEDKESDFDSIDRSICNHLSQFNDGGYGMATERLRLATKFIETMQDANLSPSAVDSVLERIRGAPFKR